MDLRLIKRRQGFDFVSGKSGLVTVENFETMIPIALFGGNVAGSTPSKRREAQQNKDWWGNATLLQNEKQQQFNSATERTLSSVALNSSGREKIQRAVEGDLLFMSDFADVSVNVSLVSVDRLRISIQIIRPDNLNQTEFVYIWDNLEKEITEDTGDAPPIGAPPETNDAFNYDFNFDL